MKMIASSKMIQTAIRVILFSEEDLHSLVFVYDEDNSNRLMNQD